MEARHLCSTDKRELLTLANDFLLLDKQDNRNEVYNIIDTCKNYSDGQRKILKVFENTYMR